MKVVTSFQIYLFWPIFFVIQNLIFQTIPNNPVFSVSIFFSNYIVRFLISILILKKRCPNLISADAQMSIIRLRNISPSLWIFQNVVNLVNLVDLINLANLVNLDNLDNLVNLVNLVNLDNLDNLDNLVNIVWSPSCLVNCRFLIIFIFHFLSFLIFLREPRINLLI